MLTVTDPTQNELHHGLTEAVPPPSDSPSGSTITFRHYQIMPTARRLLRDGQDLEIGGRAFDLLVILTEARGCIVSKDELYRKIWPSTTVDESNLRFQMAALRRVLGRDRDILKNVPGRGYMLADDFPNQKYGHSEQCLPAHDRVASTGNCLSAIDGVNCAANERNIDLEQENSRLRQLVVQLAMGIALLARVQRDPGRNTENSQEHSAWLCCQVQKRPAGPQISA